MADSYFAGFDLITRDASGVEIPLSNFTLTVRYSGGADITTVDSDDNGFVWSELLTGVDPESQIEFYDNGATYAGVSSQTTKATALDAFTGNKQNRFIIDDLFPTTNETLYVDIYLQDRTGTPTEPEYIGTVAPGETLYKPYESVKNKNLRFYKIERDDEGARRVVDFTDADFIDFDPARSIEDEIGVDTTEVVGGTVGNLFYHKTGDVVGEIPADLTDPGADRIAFWDDSAGQFTWLTVGSGLSITGTTLAASSSGLTVGSGVTGGGANRVLYEDASQNLAASSNLTFDGTHLTVGGDVKARAGTALIGEGGTGLPGLWFGGNVASPSTSNYSLLYSSVDGLIFNTPTGKKLSFRQNNVDQMFIQNTGDVFFVGSILSGTAGSATSILFGNNIGGLPGLWFGSATSAPSFSDYAILNVTGGGAGIKFNTPSSTVMGFRVANAEVLQIGAGTLEVTDAANIVLGTTTGTKIGAASNQKLSFWGAAPVIQQSTFTLASDNTPSGSDTIDIIAWQDTITEIIDNISDIKSILTTIGVTN